MISQRPSEVEANVQSARGRTAQLEQDLMEVLSLLRSSLRKPPVRWEDLTEDVSFDAPRPQKPSDPEKVIKAPYPNPPDPSAFVPELTISDKLLSGRGKQKSAEAAARLELAEAVWRNQCAEIDKTFNEAVALRESLYQEKFQRYETALYLWETSRNEHVAKQDQQRELISNRRSDYKAAKAPGVEYFLGEVLARSEYPKSFPRSSSVNFDESNGLLIVDFDLPKQSALPTIKEVKYIVTRDEFQEIPLSDAWQKKTYEEVLYQIALRTIHKLYAADEPHVLKSVVFNGWIQGIETATGTDTRVCILSVQANREEFLQINLGQVDPKACFQKLNGIGSADLWGPAPIQPILTTNKEAAGFASFRNQAI
jgi:restriction system protein